MNTQTALLEICPHCGKQALRLDEEESFKGILYSITCYAWCGIGSQRFRTKDLVFKWLKNRIKHTTPKTGGGL